MFKASSSIFVKRIWPFIVPHKKHLCLTFLLIITASWLSLIPSYLLIELTNNILVPLQNHQVVEHRIIFLVLAGFFLSWLLSWLMSIASSLISNHINNRINQHIRLKTFNHLINLSLDDFYQIRSGDLINRIGYETQLISNFICSTIPNAVQDFFLMLFIFFFILTINLKLAIITVIPLPILILVSYLFKNKLRYLIKLTSYNLSLMIDKLSEVIHGIRIVKCFNQEAKEREKFALLSNKYTKVRLASEGMWSIISPSNHFLCNLGLLAIWSYGINLMMSGQLSLGALSSFIAYAGRLYGVSNSFNFVYQNYQATQNDLERLYEIIDKPDSNQFYLAKKSHSSATKGEFEIHNLNFYYGTRQVLFNINFKIKAGEKVGIVGHSGAGKTTLINLLCRFCETNSGDIYLDKENIKNIPTESYRKQIGIVLQEPFLFSGTIADNIAYAKPNASIEEIINAARFSKAHEFILQQPLGYQTSLMEGGVTLSGGEKQRIAIARAILANPNILILDEPVSAVDGVTEQKINHAIEHLTKGKTTIVISHRLSSFRNFDKLIFISNGKILEIGSHNELMSNKSHYYEFYNAQYKQTEAQAAC